MPYWTSSAIVKKHLQILTRLTADIFNERHILSGAAVEQLLQSNVDTGTENIKIMQLTAPHPDSGNPITLNGVTQVNLEKNHIAWDSVVVASDATLTTLYAENKDFIIAYESGKINRVTGSAIGDGSSVYVWYLYFNRFIKNTDYEIDYSAGEINRLLPGTSIPDGATVMCDYSHSQITVTDDIINQAIAEAEDFMVERLSDSYTTASVDQGLISTATYYALSIISLSQAYKETSRSIDESSALSNRLQQLSERYANLGDLYFQSFSRTLSRFAGGVMENRNKGPYYKKTISSPSITARRRKR